MNDLPDFTFADDTVVYQSALIAALVGHQLTQDSIRTRTFEIYRDYLILKEVKETKCF